jgi:hypothetical protein
MSIDHDSTLVIGYVVPSEDVFKQFLVRRKEVAHMEERFDSRTGKKMPSEKVVDEPAGYDIVIGDEKFDGPDDGKMEGHCLGDEEVEAVAALVGCSGFMTGDYYNGNIVACFVPSKLNAEPGGDVYLLKEVCKFQKEIERIGKALKKLKIDPGIGGIHVVNVVM